MSRTKLTFEFEINAPASLLYSYLTVPNSLKQWFADKVTEDKNGSINFVWDNEDHIATIGGQKLNQFIRYNFNDSTILDKNEQPYLEFKIEVNELTQTSFIKITDYYMDETEEDATNLWNNLIDNLKDVIGA